MKVQHPIVPLEQVVSLVKRGETPKEGIIYRQIGVRLWGKGSYERESMDGGDTKYKTLYKVKAADLIVNKIWARNGSVAVITAEVDACFVSAEFPTFELNKKKILPRWLHWITKTPILWDQFDAKSHGTSGKNRIQPNKILLAKIPLPDIEKQKYLLDLIEHIADKHEKLTNLHEISLGDVQKLRQAILQEAVQGKLIAQDPNDEPASELLKRIKAEKEKLIAEGKIKKTKPLPPITENEIPYELPLGWEWIYLPDITAFENNAIKRGPFGSAIRKEYFVPDGYKVYEQRNAIYDDFTLGKYFINEKKFQEMKSFQVKPKDIIISCSGTIGKVAIAPENIKQGIINQALLKITLNEEAILNKYFKILFENFVMRSNILQDLKGTAMKNITSVKILKTLPLPIPTKDEQKRIVAKVDQLMHLCDELETKLNQSKKDSEMLMQAVLHEAFS